jgi:diacylglycerol kinase (CTP)
MSHLRDPTRLLNTSPRPTRSSPSLSPGPSSTRTRRRGSSASKENEPILKSSLSDKEGKGSMSKMNGHATQPVWRDSPVELEDQAGSPEIRKRASTRRTKSPSPSSPRSHPKPSPSASGSSGYYNGLPTLPPISDQDPDSAILDSPTSEKEFKPPPPAPSAMTGTGNKPVTRKRRSSSIKRKPSPGVRPVAAVDWEIPRKTLHSSIGTSDTFPGEYKSIWLIL